jgi:hypothetical protein
MNPQERLAALEALLELINDEINPGKKQLQAWPKMKDALNPSQGQHHANRYVTRGQLKGDVERLIESVSKMVRAAV